MREIMGRPRALILHELLIGNDVFIFRWYNRYILKIGS